MGPDNIVAKRKVIRNKMNIIYDCDPGVDDGLAIILALNSGMLNISGITTVFGNSPLSQTTLNACRILDYLGRDIPVAGGASKPWKARRVDAKSIHGNDGLGDSDLLPKNSPRKIEGRDAADFILNGIKNERVKVVIATGSLTNIANAFRKDPKTMNKLHELVIMGGSFYRPGNIERLSEFNFYSDPHAADYVLQHSKVKTVIVPLNVTHQVIFTHRDRAAIANTRSGKLAASISAKYQKAYIDSGYKGNPLHDPLAMGYVINPSFVELIQMNVKVETEGKYTRGVCVPEERPWMKVKPNVHVALSVQSEKFLKYFIKTVSKD